MIVEIIDSKVLANAAALTAKTTPSDRDRWWVTGVGGCVFKVAATNGDYEADDSTPGFWCILDRETALILARVRDTLTTDYTDISSAVTLNWFLETDELFAGRLVSLTDGSTVIMDIDVGLNATVTLGGNRTLSITNAYP